MSRDIARDPGDHALHMRIDRGYLFWGICFVLLGAIPLADREGWVDVAGLGDALRLWPLLIIGIGVVILFSRTRLALVATVVGALVLGTLAGTALTSFGGGTVFDCIRVGDAALPRTTTRGTLDPSASVRVHIDCGDLNVGTASGSDWTLDAGHAGDPPRVEASADDLSIRPADGPPRRQDWALALPVALASLQVEANASSTTLALGATALSRLDATVNAGDLSLVAPVGRMDRLELAANAADVEVEAPSTDIADLDVEANAASVTLSLGGSATGSLEGAAMSARVCVPPDASLDIRTGDDVGFSFEADGAVGLAWVGDRWLRQGTGPQISLSVGGTASSVTLVDDGSCA
ncbi:MAG: hypothetical protein U0667_12200 [Chloroflexota bacterium]